MSKCSVISTLHVHLDHDNCLEMILVKGKSPAVQKLANALIATKGVRHWRFTTTTTRNARFFDPSAIFGEINDPNFGRIAGAAAPRLVQLAVKVHFQRRRRDMLIH
jgi:hypothetical protein